MSDALAWLEGAAQERAAAGLTRVLTSRPADDPSLDLASNDYLGLARHPDVVAAGVAALRTWGAGATGSRLVTGTTALHGQLEAALAAVTGAADALVFSSGYLANLGAVTALAGAGTLVVAEERNHASLVDACRLSRARVVVTPNADVDAVRAALAARTEDRALVVTDAVFSVSGELAPLAALHDAARAGGAALLVDEAHALGVVAPGGAAEQAGLAGEPDVVLTATLSKALGSSGGVVLGPPGLRAHLVDTARAFVFDTGLAPASCGSALAALGLLDAPRLAALRRAADALADAVGVPRTAGAVVAVPVGDAATARDAQVRCAEQGVRVGCFRPPSVPPGLACLRLAARADLTPADAVRAGDVVRRALGRGAAGLTPRR